MSAWTFWTWASIAVLTAGSIAVFAWFLRDALRFFRATGTRTGNGSPAADAKEEAEPPFRGEA